MKQATQEGLEDTEMPQFFRESAVLDTTSPEVAQRERSIKVSEKLKSVSPQGLEAALEENFIYSKDVARIIACAMRTGKNVILWGPPGHAKSAMVLEALTKLGLKDDTFVLDFGEGMDEPTLWGGLNFKRLHEEHILDFNPERSFLNYPVVVFEELFDAPPQVLCALKNTLTAKCLHKSADPFKMQTKVIIACTNKSPAEISQIGESAKALIERFPLQLKVEWPDYSAKSYAQLFSKTAGQRPDFDNAFAELIADAGTKRAPISPRTAVHAHQIVSDASQARGSKIPDAEALSYLSYVAGLEEIGRKKSVEYAELVLRQEFVTKVERATEMMEALRERLDLISEPQGALDAVTDLSALEEEFNEKNPPKEMRDEIEKTIKSIQGLAEEFQQRALRLTKHRKQMAA